MTYDGKKETGFCWSCGRQCKKFFCNEKCYKAYNRKNGIKSNKFKKRP